MNFKQFYERHFPTDLKPSFESWLSKNMSASFYSEDTKFAVSCAYVAGATAAMERSIRERRMTLDRFEKSIDRLEQAQ